MPKKTNSIVKESNALARAEIIPAAKSVWEERMIAAVAARVRTDDLEFTEQIIPPEEISSRGEISTLQFSEMKKAADRLAATRYRVKAGKRGIMIYPIFEKIGINDTGKLVGKLNLGLKEHYIELREQFALRSLPEFQALTSIYSQILYRYLNACRNSPTGDWEAAVEDLYTLVDAPPSFRKDFRAFRVNVLEVAMKEINEKTELRFDCELIRHGKRKVSGIRFVFDVAVKARQKQAKEREEQEVRHKAADECYLKHYNFLQQRCTPSMRGRKAKICKYCATPPGLLGTMLAMDGANRTKQIWSGF